MIAVVFIVNDDSRRGFSLRSANLVTHERASSLSHRCPDDCFYLQLNARFCISSFLFPAFNWVWTDSSSCLNESDIIDVHLIDAFCLSTDLFSWVHDKSRASRANFFNTVFKMTRRLFMNVCFVDNFYSANICKYLRCILSFVIVFPKAKEIFLNKLICENSITFQFNYTIFKTRFRMTSLFPIVLWSVIQYK